MRSPRCVQLAHAEEDAAVLFQAEVVGFERAGYLDVERVVHQNGAQDEAFGVEIGRESTFERDVGPGLYGVTAGLSVVGVIRHGPTVLD